MTRNAFVLHFLKYLATKKQAIATGNIKSQMLGYKNVSSNEVFDQLTNRGYATIENNQIQISEKGKVYIETLEKTELDRLHEAIFEDYDLALIEFLYYREDYVKLDDFPETLQTMAPQHGNSVGHGNIHHTLFRLGPYIKEEYQWYILNDTGKAYYKQHRKKVHQITILAPHPTMVSKPVQIQTKGESN